MSRPLPHLLCLIPKQRVSERILRFAPQGVAIKNDATQHSHSVNAVGENKIP